jgi:hypothetical protein
MEHISKKSEENIASAALLIEKAYYASSVHCAYFGCIQMMLHAYKCCKDLEDDEYDRHKQSGSQSAKGTHKWIIMETQHLLEDYRPRGSFKDSNQFRTYIGNLKQARTDADYKDMSIDETRAKRCLTEAKQTIEIVKKWLLNE